MVTSEMGHSGCSLHMHFFSPFFSAASESLS